MFRTILKRNLSTSLKSNERTLVLMRHGQSVWNKENLFTGWADVPLTEQGEAEAKEAGRLLKANGFQFDQIFTSTLKVRVGWDVYVVCIHGTRLLLYEPMPISKIACGPRHPKTYDFTQTHPNTPKTHTLTTFNSVLSRLCGWPWKRWTKCTCQ